MRAVSLSGLLEVDEIVVLFVFCLVFVSCFCCLVWFCFGALFASFFGCFGVFMTFSK